MLPRQGGGPLSEVREAFRYPSLWRGQHNCTASAAVESRVGDLGVTAQKFLGTRTSDAGFVCLELGLPQRLFPRRPAAEEGGAAVATVSADARRRRGQRHT